MSDHYEYYLNNPHERDEDMPNDMEWLEDEILDAANDGTFVYDLLADQYVDFDLSSTTLRAMFKSYCNRMNATKQEDKDNADKDLLIFTKSLMAAMYEAATEIIIERSE
jgi:F0F1-type ATP synthase gamma subunit